MNSFDLVIGPRCAPAQQCDDRWKQTEDCVPKQILNQLHATKVGTQFCQNQDSNYLCNYLVTSDRLLKNGTYSVFFFFFSFFKRE